MPFSILQRNYEEEFIDKMMTVKIINIKRIGM